MLRGASAYKTFLIVPYAVAPAVAGVLWMFIFNPTLGVLSYVMRMFGIDWNYLVDADQALTLLVIAAVWKQVSYNFIFFLAGLQAIPKSLLEAAAMDGAGGPGQDTNILVYKVFVDGFRNMDFGGSAAQSVILMVMVIILTVIQFRFIERRVNY